MNQEFHAEITIPLLFVSSWHAIPSAMITRQANSRQTCDLCLNWCKKKKKKKKNLELRGDSRDDPMLLT